MPRRSNPESARPAHRQLHGRAHGKKLRAYHAGLVETLLPRLALPGGHEPLDPAALFDFPIRALVVEIGFGGGEHLADEANARADTGFIGCEPFVNGVAKLLARVEEEGLRNVRVHDRNALDILPRLPRGCVDRIDLLYPDPWPKARHRKRRFVSMQALAEMAGVLRPGGELRFATDIDDYAAWTLSRAQASPFFEWRAESAADWMVPWAGWKPTRFEERARREGRSSAYLTFVRV